MIACSPACSKQSADRGCATDATDLGSLFVELRPELERFIRRRISCPQLAADMASEIYLKLTKAADFRGSRSHARNYVFRVASNHVVDHVRVETRRADILRESAHLFTDVEPGPEPCAMARSELALLDSALETLPPKARSALILSAKQGMTHGEIAANLGLSVSMVEKHVSRAVRRCRQRLRELGEDAVVPQLAMTPA